MFGSPSFLVPLREKAFYADMTFIFDSQYLLFYFLLAIVSRFFVRVYTSSASCADKQKRGKDARKRPAPYSISYIYFFVALRLSLAVTRHYTHNAAALPPS